MNGPPPKKTPRLSSEASRKTPDDDTDYVGRVAAPRKIDLQRPEVSVVRLRPVAHSGNLRAFADVRGRPARAALTAGHSAARPAGLRQHAASLR